MATFTIIQPSGATTEREPGNKPTLKELQAAVGGHIEVADQFLDDGREAYINDEGLLRGLAPNLKGSVAVRWPWGERNIDGDLIPPLFGPVVILEGFDPEGEVD